MPKALSRGSLVQNKSKENEVFLAINELQKWANSVYRAGPFRVSTSDAAVHVVWTSEDMPEGALWTFLIYGQAQGGGAFAQIERSAMFSRAVGGAIAQFGTGTNVFTARTDGNIQVQTTTSGNAAVVQVQDLTGRSLSWALWVEARVSI